MTDQDAGVKGAAGSQTLDRGLQALEFLAETGGPISIARMAEGLGVHRSSAYRVLRTLEARRFVLRDQAGMIRLGPRLAALGRGAAPTLTQLAGPEVVRLANELGMTTFVTVLDADEAITIISVEPSRGSASIAQRPGARHPITRGAPSHAIESSLSLSEHQSLFAGAPMSEAAKLAKEQGYSVSKDEIIQGVTSVAVPLRIHGEAPAALAIVTIGLPENLAYLVSELRAAAGRMAYNSW